MSDPAIVLLVDPDEESARLIRAILELERKYRLVIAPPGVDAAPFVRETRPDMLVVRQGAPGVHALALCQEVRHTPGLESVYCAVLTEPGAPDIRLAGLTHGADDFLPCPLEPARWLTSVNAMLRLRAIHQALLHDRAELEDLRATVLARFDQLLNLLVHMLDMRIPGAAERGERIAALAVRVAARFRIPEAHVHDLELAARLHELGRMLTAEDACGVPLPAARALERWQYIIATHAVFQKVKGLEGAAELVAAVYENWDGTGHPNRLLQGQIPLRSRILRVLVDLHAELGAPDASSQDQVLQGLQDHAGTRYDPIVLVHLNAVLAGDDVAATIDRHVIAIPDLQPGMTLAEDLLTASGLKLLARDTRLTAATLEVIRRRHGMEPIVEGAIIRRAS